MVKKVEADLQDEAVSPVSRWLCGIDVGGTFTDAAAINLETGAWRYAKVLTTRGELRDVRRRVRVSGLQ